MPSRRSHPTTASAVRGSVLLVDDSPLFRASTAALLRISGLDCDEVEGPDDALERLARRRFDVLVSDLVMDGRPRLDFLEQVSASPSAPAVILITAHPSIESAVKAVDLRLAGYLPKPFESEDLLKRVHEAIQRRRADPGVSRASASLERLTPREIDVVEQLLQGYRIPTVARRLGISPHTVRRHLKSIFPKLEVASQAELMEKLKP